MNGQQMYPVIPSFEKNAGDLEKWAMSLSLDELVLEKTAADAVLAERASEMFRAIQETNDRVREMAPKVASDLAARGMIEPHEVAACTAALMDHGRAVHLLKDAAAWHGIQPAGASFPAEQVGPNGQVKTSSSALPSVPLSQTDLARQRATEDYERSLGMAGNRRS